MGPCHAATATLRKLPQVQGVYHLHGIAQRRRRSYSSCRAGSPENSVHEFACHLVCCQERVAPRRDIEVLTHEESRRLSILSKEHNASIITLNLDRGRSSYIVLCLRGAAPLPEAEADPRQDDE